MPPPSPHSPLHRSFALVRRRRLGVNLLRVLALLTVACLVVASVLIASDVAYQPSRLARLASLAAGALAVGAGAWWWLRRVWRPLSDLHVALLIETVHPQLQGLALAAAGRSCATPGSDLAQLLNEAMRDEAERRLGALDLAAVIDSRPLARNIGLTLTMLAAAVLIVVAAPEQSARELQRTLTPWRQLPPSAAELAARASSAAQERAARELALAASRAASAAQAPVSFHVSPGAVDLARGGMLDVACTVSRVDGPVQVRVRLSDGSWRDLSMEAAADDARSFTAQLTDLDDDSAYCVVMGAQRSPVYAITVYDRATVLDLHADYQAPAYAQEPPRTLKGGDLEALSGSVAHLTLRGSVALGTAQLLCDDGTAITLTVHGDTAVGDVPIDHDGGYRLSACDARSRHALDGLAAHYAIHAIIDQPPTLTLLYPALDEEVHPLATIAIAADVSDDVGLKDVRLVSAYGLEEPRSEHRSCMLAATGRPARHLLAQFTIDLKQRPVHLGDTIIFHVEAEDVKGQQVTTDPYVLKVRDYELMQTYVDGGHPPGNGTASYATLMGALHDLAARKAQLTAAQFHAECAHIAQLYLRVDPYSPLPFPYR